MDTKLCTNSILTELVQKKYVNINEYSYAYYLNIDHCLL